MGKLVINESEKKRIKSLYGLITESNNYSCQLHSGITYYNTIIGSYNGDLNKAKEDLNSIANELKTKVPERIACQAALNKIRPDFKGRNLIILDQVNNTAYIFDKENNYISSTWIISGRDTPNKEWEEFVKLDYDGRVQYLKDNKDITNDSEARKLAIIQPGASYLSPAIYSGTKGETHKGYEGDDKVNLFRLFDLFGVQQTQAVHGTAGYSKRKTAQSDASKYETGDLKFDSSKLNLSSGCINIPGDFIENNRKYLSDAFYFAIGFDNENYLVKSENVVGDKCVRPDETIS